MRKGSEIRLGPGDRERLEAVIGSGRGVFKGIVDLQAAINRYLAETNENPKSFTWTADPNAIIEKVGRGRLALNAFGVTG
jgi:hypothetical protein